MQLPHFHFWVTDTGVGIPPELQERIFEPFVKAEPPNQPRSGIGLGLSITRRLVALHGGSITLESTPGMGSAFHVYLPLPGVATTLSQVSSLDVDPLVLLWLSSREIPAFSIRNLCEKNGYEVIWLSDLAALERTLTIENRLHWRGTWITDGLATGQSSKSCAASRSTFNFPCCSTNTNRFGLHSKRAGQLIFC